MYKTQITIIISGVWVEGHEGAVAHTKNFLGGYTIILQPLQFLKNRQNFLKFLTKRHEKFISNLFPK